MLPGKFYDEIQIGDERLTPRVTVTDNARIAVNGLYRHGFLVAPALAEATVAHVVGGRTDAEVVRCA